MNKIYKLLYLLRGRKPWTLGYVPYKEEKIATALADVTLLDRFVNRQPLPPEFAQRLDERLVEFPWLMSSLPKESGKLLDAGSTINHSYIINQTVLQNKDITIMTLAPEDKSFWQKRISYIYGDLRNAPLRDNWFDSVTCISTLEHVGMDNSIYTADKQYHQSDTTSHLKVIAELQRMLKPGGRLYLTVPYGLFKVMGFQQVFNAEMVQNVIKQFGGKVIEETYFKYTVDGWQLAQAADCASMDYFDIHVTKQYDADYAAAARAVACLILEK
ncbi:MAG: methyltransferase domain-containing protein [Patescibacteria group bacterium]|jgi:SAM-dependent methyltransferase